MRILDGIEIEKIISNGRLISEQKITAMLDELEIKHPGIYRVIYGEPSDGIALINKEMAELYIDLSFDVICFFINAFGELPVVNDEEQFVFKKLSLIDAELKSLTNEIPMNSKFRKTLQERFVQRCFEASIQLELMQYLEVKVVRYASFKKKRKKAIRITSNLLFVLVRLMGDLYKTIETKDV